tara:strand:- start:25846 stop:26865 length:1020 start_codon:yes stop_codon:yes gene_type:complete
MVIVKSKRRNKLKKVKSKKVSSLKGGKLTSYRSIFEENIWNNNIKLEKGQYVIFKNTSDYYLTKVTSIKDDNSYELTEVDFSSDNYDSSETGKKFLSPRISKMVYLLPLKPESLELIQNERYSDIDILKKSKNLEEGQYISYKGYKVEIKNIKYFSNSSGKVPMELIISFGKFSKKTLDTFSKGNDQKRYFGENYVRDLSYKTVSIFDYDLKIDIINEPKIDNNIDFIEDLKFVLDKNEQETKENDERIQMEKEEVLSRSIASSLNPVADEFKPIQNVQFFEPSVPKPSKSSNKSPRRIRNRRIRKRKEELPKDGIVSRPSTPSPPTINLGEMLKISKK